MHPALTGIKTDFYFPRFELSLPQSKEYMLLLAGVHDRFGRNRHARTPNGATISAWAYISGLSFKSGLAILMRIFGG